MIWAITLFLAAAAPARAQVDVGTGFGPEAFLQGERGTREQMPILPLALATSLAFDATTWADVQASTVPAKDISLMIKKGYYKLEVIQTVLLASRSKVTLKEIMAAHDKGKSLRELAKDKQVDFDALYDDALRLDKEIIDRHLPSVMTVTSGSAELWPVPKSRRREKKP